MVSNIPDVKSRDEQFPLLKVNGGNVDSPNKQPSIGWSITCAQRRTWLNKWSTFASACWMSFIFLGICFLALYTLGMAINRRQTILVQYLREHEHSKKHDKPDNNLFYHYIVESEKAIPFQMYSDYLSVMSEMYPYLRINVFFLTDDPFQSFRRWPRHNSHSEFINKMMPILSNHKVDESTKFFTQLHSFQEKHRNVNITIMSLSNYIAMTPLKYRYRNVPISYMTFYVRMFAVWQHGGIGLDLPKFYNKYIHHEPLDDKIYALLRNYNDKTDNSLSKQDNLNREDDDLSMLLYGFYFVVNQAWNETRSLLNHSLTWPAAVPSINGNTTAIEPLLVHKNKREALSSNANNSIDNIITNFTLNSTTENVIKAVNSKASSIVINLFDKLPFSDSDGQSIEFNAPVIKNENNIEKISTHTNKSEINPPQILLVYGSSVLSDAIEPSYYYNVPELVGRSIFKDINVNDVPIETTVIPDDIKHLTIDNEGKFIASNSRFHPFLGHLISIGYKRVSPKLAIEDTVLTHCPGILRIADSYCNNINFI